MLLTDPLCTGFIIFLFLKLFCGGHGYPYFGNVCSRFESQGRSLTCIIRRLHAILQILDLVGLETGVKRASQCGTVLALPLTFNVYPSSNSPVSQCTDG